MHVWVLLKIIIYHELSAIAGTKQGKLPMLNVDGKVIVQSGAISRYLARELGAYISV